MKVLLKKEVCGSYEQYIKLTGKAKKGQSRQCTFKKKKKKKGTPKRRLWVGFSCTQMGTKCSS